MPDSAVHCPLCRSPAKLINDRHPGYQLPHVFSIYACRYCDLQFAWPMRSNADLYEHIYRQADRLTGYDFYAELAKGVTQAKSPLNYLAGKGPGYWFIKQALAEKLPQQGHGSQVMEIGSGLGYLTHALVAAGYDARGIDISETAVANAKARFGEHYLCADLHAYADRHRNSVRAAVMIEVIEHLPDPLSMLAAIHRLLEPGGFALVTTPNKSVYRAREYWQTDNPPVHLWWLSETSARRLAQAAGFEIDLWDFSGFQRPGDHARYAPSQSPMKPAMLDERGDLITVERRAPSPLRRLKSIRDSLLPSLKRRKQERRRQAARLRWADEHGDAIGMVLTKPMT